MSLKISLRPIQHRAKKVKKKVEDPLTPEENALLAKYHFLRNKKATARPRYIYNTAHPPHAQSSTPPAIPTLNTPLPLLQATVPKEDAETRMKKAKIAVAGTKSRAGVIGVIQKHPQKTRTQLVTPGKSKRKSSGFKRPVRHKRKHGNKTRGEGPYSASNELVSKAEKRTKTEAPSSQDAPLSPSSSTMEISKPSTPDTNPGPGTVPGKHPNTSVFVGHLPRQITEAALDDEFSRFGRIKNIRLMAERGFAFIRYANAGEAVHAIDDMNGRILGSQKVTVSWARPKGSRERGDGRSNEPPSGGGAPPERGKLPPQSRPLSVPLLSEANNPPPAPPLPPRPRNQLTVPSGQQAQVRGNERSTHFGGGGFRGRSSNFRGGSMQFKRGNREPSLLSGCSEFASETPPLPPNPPPRDHNTKHKSVLMQESSDDETFTPSEDPHAPKKISNPYDEDSFFNDSGSDSESERSEHSRQSIDTFGCYKHI